MHDVYCGLRGFTKAFYERMNLRCTGMEFATEMIVKASLNRVRSSEIPITLHKDGREGDASHLRTFRDGWRTLRLFLLFSPRWLFLIPALFLLTAGFAVSGLAFSGQTINGVTLGLHSLLVGNLAVLIALQLLFFWLFAKTFAVNEGLLPEDDFVSWFYALFNLEKTLFAGALFLLAGTVLIGVVAWRWRDAGFGNLDYEQTMRWVIPGGTLLSLGAQAIFGAFLVSAVGLNRK